MLKNLMFIAAIFIWHALSADCANVHCRFQYMGHHGTKGATRDDFMRMPAVNDMCEKYFAHEVLPFREMNWCLSKLEASVYDGHHSQISNAVHDILSVIDEYKVFLRNQESGTPRKFPARLRMLLLERIEYSLARMVLHEKRNLVTEFIEVLLPDSIINESRTDPSWHSIATFKRMLILADAIENYHDSEGCYPLNLRPLKLQDVNRKCACGHDIDYEQHGSDWILRSRCESFDGALAFDQYIPTIYVQRKKLDLCFSRTFNHKRKSLYYGELMGGGDVRLMGQVFHNPAQNGVHGIKFRFPSAGCCRVLPKSENKPCSDAVR